MVASKWASAQSHELGAHLAPTPLLYPLLSPCLAPGGDSHGRFLMKTLLRGGYLWVEIDAYRPGADHFGSGTRWSYPVHRLVAEQRLGRPLSAGEIVHHIDENPLNNDPANLQITTRAEHTRQHQSEREGTFCTSCGVELRAGDMGARSLCHKCYNREHYRRNREQHLAYHKKRRARAAQALST
jgi:predicted RNA-binding Zn-ribbon protein involved in translation (DUF1610 family)